VKDAIKEVTEVGTERGMNNWYNSLVKQRNDGTFTPMAFHPGGGGRAGGWFGSLKGNASLKIFRRVLGRR
jgi:hypothetical protein